MSRKYYEINLIAYDRNGNFPEVVETIYVVCDKDVSEYNLSECLFEELKKYLEQDGYAEVTEEILKDEILEFYVNGKDDLIDLDCR